MIAPIVLSSLNRICFVWVSHNVLIINVSPSLVSYANKDVCLAGAMTNSLRLVELHYRDSGNSRSRSLTSKDVV